MALTLQCPEGQRLVLEPNGGLAVGAGPDCAVALRGTGVPERLALLNWEYGDGWLRVLALEPPVAVNGRPVQRLARLYAGDRICFGAFCVDLLGREAQPDSATDPIEAFVLRARGGAGNGAVLAGPVLHLDAAGEPVSAAAGAVSLIRTEGRLELRSDSAVRVNGWPVSGTVIASAGDQIQVGARRYQVEVVASALSEEPPYPGSGEPVSAPDPVAEVGTAQSDSNGLWWLIALSALITGVVSALLYFRT